jgi:hypothetical protein
MVSRNIAGQTKKATVVAATFVSWAAGNAIGKLPFPSKIPYLASILPPIYFLPIFECLQLQIV